jgi:sarcosine oxidase
VQNTHDVVVIGLGAHGAAAAFELARRGAAVLGVDRHTPPHDLGSTHGRSRIIREAYFEHPLYVPLVQRAFELWEETEELTGSTLYRRTGGLMVGPPHGELVMGALASARTHSLEHEILDAAAIRSRFPGLLPDADHVGVLEPRAGILNPEAAIRAMLSLAQGYGAEIRPNTGVVAWNVEPGAGDVVIHTTSGTLRARHAVFAAGPWLPGLLASGPGPHLALPLTVERQLSHWFAPAQGVHVFRADSCPIALWEYDAGRYLYTFPDLGHGVKAGIHHEGENVAPDSVDRTVYQHEVERARQLIEQCMPGAAHTHRDSSICLYTNTPDGHFIIDAHPAHERVTLVSACSGHGFKFATAIGEAVAEMLLDGGSRFDLTPFAVRRF